MNRHRSLGRVATRIVTGLLICQVTIPLTGYAQDVNAELRESAKKADPEMVSSLLEKGAEINSKDESDRTALMEAAYWGRAEVVKLLLEKGASVDAKDKDGRTALIDAAGAGHTQIVEMLLGKG